MSYTPKPIDTADMQLPEDLDGLVKRLAENAHDIWAIKRVDGGWQYGPKRDDMQRLHPCLMPYSDLPASEQAYDRQMVEETVKAILALGYRITTGETRAADDD